MSCKFQTLAPVEEFSGKCNVLLQAYISRARVNSFTLISDTNYIASNAGRVARALFEMCLKNGRASAALKFLRLAKSIDHRIWWFQSPLRHFEGELKKNVYVALEDQKVASEDGYSTLDRAISLLDMEPNEVGQLCHCFRDGELIQKFVRFLPRVEVTCTVHPITKGTLRFHIQLDPIFNWSGRFHGGAEGFWLWVEDSDNDRTYHNEYILFSRRNHPESTALELVIPVFDPLPQQYFIRIVSDSWVGCEALIPVSFRHVLLDGLSSPTYHTSLFDLTPLPIKALADPDYEQLYERRFDVFNPIQTQLFHILYHRYVLYGFVDLSVFNGLFCIKITNLSNIFRIVVIVRFCLGPQLGVERPLVSLGVGLTRLVFISKKFIDIFSLFSCRARSLENEEDQPQSKVCLHCTPQITGKGTPE